MSSLRPFPSKGKGKGKDGKKGKKGGKKGGGKPFLFGPPPGPEDVFGAPPPGSLAGRGLFPGGAGKGTSANSIEIGGFGEQTGGFGEQAGGFGAEHSSPPMYPSKGKKPASPKHGGKNAYDAFTKYEGKKGLGKGIHIQASRSSLFSTGAKVKAVEEKIMVFIFYRPGPVRGSAGATRRT